MVTAGLPAPHEHLQIPTVMGRVSGVIEIGSIEKLVEAAIIEIGAAHADLPYVISEGDIEKHQNKDENEWLKLLVVALEGRMLKLARYPVNNPAGELVHYESPVRLQIAPDEPWLAASEFVPWAIRLDLITRVDNLVAELAFDELRSQGFATPRVELWRKPACTTIADCHHPMYHGQPAIELGRQSRKVCKIPMSWPACQNSA